MAKFKWDDANPACVATYKVLEGNDFLDQFEDIDIPFAKADTLKIGSLRSFPKTTSTQLAIELFSLEIARQFLKHVVRTFTVTKQRPKVTSGAIIEVIATVFADADKTLTDLAAVVDAEIKFPGEASQP